MRFTISNHNSEILTVHMVQCWEMEVFGEAAASRLCLDL